MPARENALRVMCLIALVGVSLQSSFPQPVANARLFWLNHAANTSDELLKEAVALTASERALLFGHLAKAWYRRDKVKARGYLLKAIAEVAPVPSRETVTEKNQRLSSVRALLVLAVNFDSELTQKINSILSTDAGQDSVEQRNANATALVQAALSVVENNPDKALSLGLMSVKVGRAPNMIHLLSQLRMRDQSAGDKLFFEVLAVTEKTLDSDMLAALSRLAFIGAAPSEAIRKHTLSVLSDILLSASQADTVCEFARIAAPLMAQFRALLPNRVQTVAAASAKCSNSSNGLGETVTGRNYDPQLKTVDDFLRAADETNNRERRVFLRSRAVYLASQNKDYDRAILILDTFDEEEREQLGEAWDNWRWEFASAGALERLQHDDILGIDRIVYATPARLRAFVEISVAGEMNSPRHRDKAVELLQNARRNLPKATNAPLDWYLSLLRRYVKLMPQDATLVLEDLVKVLNQADPPRGEDGGNNSVFNLTPIDLPTVLLESDLAQVRSIIAKITVKETRLRFTLSILECQLKLADATPSTGEIRTV